jgi:predicted transcriptional regulator
MGRTVNQFDQQRRLKLHSRGLTDSQLAAEVGITPGAASVWRKKEGLKRNNLRSEYETTEKERSIMSSFMSDLMRNAAPIMQQMESLGVTVEIITERREQITPGIALVNGKAVLSDQLKARIRSKRGRDKS